MKSTATMLTMIALGVILLSVSALAQTSSQSGPSQDKRDVPSHTPYGPVTTEPSWFFTKEGRTLLTSENELQAEANDVVHRLGSAKSDAEKKDLKGKLETALGKQFDLRQQRHTLEIERLEAKVTRLKQLVEKRKESRSDIIAKRLDQLIRDSEGLGW
jgi:hypothetical protein